MRYNQDKTGPETGSPIPELSLGVALDQLESSETLFFNSLMDLNRTGSEVSRQAAINYRDLSQTSLTNVASLIFNSQDYNYTRDEAGEQFETAYWGIAGHRVYLIAKAMTRENSPPIFPMAIGGSLFFSAAPSVLGDSMKKAETTDEIIDLISGAYREELRRTVGEILTAQGITMNYDVKQLRHRRSILKELKQNSSFTRGQAVGALALGMSLGAIAQIIKSHSAEGT